MTEKMNDTQEAQVRRKFSVAAILAVSGQPEQKPTLKIMDDDEFREKHPEATPVQDVKEGIEALKKKEGVPPEELQSWNKYIKSGMTIGEIKAIIREKGTKEEVSDLDEAEAQNKAYKEGGRAR